MEWVYEKYLRNIEKEEVEKRYIERSMHVACGMRCGPPQYPTRPVGKYEVVPIGGFTQHPNESEDM